MFHTFSLPSAEPGSRHSGGARHPHEVISCEPRREGAYPYDDPAVIRQLTAQLMQRCVHRGCPLPAAIVDELKLATSDQHAIGLEKALLALTDIGQRRAVVIELCKEILALRTVPTSSISL